MTTWVDCTNCPCLNSDYEYGASCNLGYTTDYLKVSESPRGYRQLSCDCKLIKVMTTDGTYNQEISDKTPTQDWKGEEIFKTEVISKNPRLVRVKDE